MFVTKKKPQGYKEHAIQFIVFYFGEGVIIIGCIANMKFYVSDIQESYKYIIIVHLENSGTEDLLLHIVQCWRACAVYEDKQGLPMVLYCSGMMYKYYYRLRFPPIRKMRKEKISKMKYSTIYHISSKSVCVLIVFNMVFNVQE